MGSSFLFLHTLWVLVERLLVFMMAHTERRDTTSLLRYP